MWSRVRAGEILQDELLIDIHTHMGPWYNFHIADDPWAEGMIEAMDTCGIDLIVTAPHAGIGPEAVEGNKQALDAIGKFPSRIFGYCTVNPNYSETEMIDQLEGYVLRNGFRGIKIHPTTHDYPAFGSGYDAMWRFAHEYELPVLVHTWESDPQCGPLLFDPIGKEFPGAKIILGHSGASAGGIRESIAAAAATPNLYLDLTKSFMHRGLLEVMVNAVGADRVLFGTDLPFLDCRAQVGYVAGGRISDGEKQKIFGLNACDIFRIDRPGAVAN